MYPVSSRFLRSLSQPHTIDTTVTCTLPSGAALTLPLSSGTWQATSGQLIRRTASLVVDGGSTVYAFVSTPGAVVRVRHGLRWSGTDIELVPVITGELSRAATQLGDGTVALSLADFGQRLAASSYLTAVSPAVTASRRSVIAAAVTDAMPAVVVTNTSSDTGNVGVSQSWTSRTDLITDLATDGGAEAFFAPDGGFTVRDLPQITDPVVWLLKSGTGGTVKSVARDRPLDKLYNTVIVKPSSSDASQGWTQQVAQITDLTNPRHPAYIGVRAFEWVSPTVLSAADALKIAQLLLTKVQGSTETLSIDAISNPALDAGDVVRVSTPTDLGTTIETHLIDSLTGDLVTGAMALQTRAATEVLAA